MEDFLSLRTSKWLRINLQLSDYFCWFIRRIEQLIQNTPSNKLISRYHGEDIEDEDEDMLFDKMNYNSLHAMACEMLSQNN